MDRMNGPLRAVLEELRRDTEMPGRFSLCYLSNLGAEEAEKVREAWPNLSTTLRRKLTSRLMEIAEADFTLDFGAVFRMAMEDEDAQVRRTAIEGLWEDQDVRLVPRLAERLREDEAVEVRAAAATSLGRFVLLGELRKIRPGPRTTAYEALMDAYQAPDEHAEVRRRALESMAYTGDERVTASIREAYASSKEEVKISAVFAMGRSCDDRWDRQVQQELFSIDPEMRCEAARACGQLQLSEAVPRLEELTGDADAQVQEAALWALGQIGGDTAREVLERFRRVSDEALRSAAEAALKEFEFLHGDLEDIFADLGEEPRW